jgi:predicted RND superfamily exporter protein
MRMIANVVPIILIFGIMAIMNIPVDLMTTLIGSIVLGLVVDDTILTWEQNIKIATHGLTPKGYGPFDH